MACIIVNFFDGFTLVYTGVVYLRQKCWIYLFIFIWGLSFVEGAQAVSSDSRFYVAVRTTFMEQGEFSLSKIARYRKKVELRREQLLLALENYQNKYLQQSIFANRLRELYIAEISILDVLINYSYELEANRSNNQIDIARKILEIDHATKKSSVSINLLASFKRPRAKNISFVVSMDNDHLSEAFNLIKNSSSVYEQQELNAKKDFGEDLSLLNPSNGLLWQEKLITEQNVFKNYDKNAEAFKDIDLMFAKRAGLYKGVKHFYGRTFLNFETHIKQENQQFKLYLGEEIHRDLTGSALASVLGYNTIPKEIVKNFTLYLPKELSAKRFIQKWNRVDGKKDINNYIKEIGTTEDNKSFIVFHEALIEKTFPELKELGPWRIKSLGHNDRREIRALALFNLWIGHKQSLQEGKLLLMKRSDSEQGLHAFYMDFSQAFEGLGASHPKRFDLLMLRAQNNSTVTFKSSYTDFHQQLDEISYADVKWMARRINEISNEQIRRAISLGEWPDKLAYRLYKNLIARKQQLSSAFNLLSPSTNEQPLSKEKFMKQRLMRTLAKPKKLGAISNEENTDIRDILKPIYSKLGSLILKASLKLTSAFSSIQVDTSTLGIDSVFLAEVEVSTDRQIVRNPQQTGQHDKWLVHDTAKVRFGLGAGFVVRGKANYYKEYKLTYPVATHAAAKHKNDFILNAMLPSHSRSVELPNHYVLLLQDSIEVEGEILLSHYQSPLSIRLSKGSGVLTRTVISKNENEYTVYLDRAPFDNIKRTLYAELLLFRIPIWHSPHSNGDLVRKAYVLSEQVTKGECQNILDDVVVLGDLGKLVEVAEHREVYSSYVEKRSISDFFGLFGATGLFREDRFTELIYSKEGDIENRDFYQLQIEESGFWDFFKLGELKRHNLRLLGRVDREQDQLSEAYLDFRFLIDDKQTTTGEFVNSSLKLVDDLSLTPDYLNFTPELYSNDEGWGQSYTQVRIGYPQKTMDKIINTDASIFYELLGKFTKRSAAFWKRRSRNKLSVALNNYKRRLRKFMSYIKQARGLTGQKRYKKLLNAINTMTWRANGGFDTSFLKIINHIVGKDSYYFEALVSLPDAGQKILLFDSTLYNHSNPYLRRDIGNYEFEFSRPESIWSAF